MKLAIHEDPEDFGVTADIEIVDTDEDNARVGCIYNNASIYTDGTPEHKEAQAWAYTEARNLAARIVGAFNG